MVRKKIKKAQAGGNMGGTDLTDLTGIARSWLEDLDLVGHDLMPAIAADLDILTLLQPPGESSKPFAQARGLQALRAGIVAGTASLEHLRLIFVVSLLLFLHPETSHLRKAVKSLLAAAEKAIAEKQLGGSSTDAVVELVATRLAGRAWNMTRSAAEVEHEHERASPREATAAALRISASL